MKENEVGRTLKAFSIIVAIVGIIGLFVMSLPLYNESQDYFSIVARLIPYLIGIMVTYIMLFGFGELLIILQKISDKMDKE